MTQLSHRVYINRPRATVFEFVSNSENITRWKKGLVEIRRKTPGPTGVGTVDTHVSQFMGSRSEVDHQITRYEPGHLVEYTVLDAQFPSTGYLRFDDEGNGTRLTIVSEAKPGGVYRLLMPLMKSVAMRQLRRDIDNLKHILQTEEAET